LVPAEIQPSEARQEIERRRARTPGQVAVELSQIYGNDFDQVTYMPGMAVIAQMRMGRTGDATRLLAPYLNGAKDALNRPNSQTLAGLLVFAELAERSKDDRAVKLVRRAADLGFTENGEMKESMPFHEEMSDSVFMAIPLLAKAGKLTGDRKYFDMAARHLTFMQKLDLRADGLYRHSPLTEAAWGRGNAFPALGLALALSDFPKDHPEFNRMLRAFQQHITALAKFQDENGMWREVVDHPGAYSEFTATAMIGTAIVRGIRNGWLDARTYQAKAERAWRAILARTGSDGKLIDVCESTGKQRSLSDYLRRAAILDRDQRGGGMAMLFATEMAVLR
jgi:rhamnogalacturonyl hydrolase YesR